MAYIGRNPAIGTQKVLDSLESQFNGTLTTFNLRYNTNTIYPPIASALIVSLGGVLQEPGTAYNVSSDQIVFATAPPVGTDCWILLYSEFGGQAGATANLTVSNDLTIGSGGEIHGPSTLILDPATVGNNTGTVEIKGNLTVQGTQTTINSTTVDLDHLALGDNEKFTLGAGGTGDNGGATEEDLQIYSDGSNLYFDSAYIITGDQAVSPNIYFRTSKTTALEKDALTILNDGKVGIGTATPSADLEISGTAGTSSTLFINAPTHSSTAASEATLKFGYSHSGSPEAVAEIKLLESSTNSFGGHLIFSIPDNNQNGGSSTSEALRITPTGQLELRKDQDNVTGRPDNRIVFKDLDTSVATGQPIGEISWYSSDAGMDNINCYIRGINAATNGGGALTIGVKASGSNEKEALRITSDPKLIFSGTGRTSPFIVADGGICIEQTYDGLLKALSLRNKDGDEDAATALSFSLNRSGGTDQDYEAGEIKLVKEQAWTTQASTVGGAMVFSTMKNAALGERVRITSNGAIQSYYNSGLPVLDSRPVLQLGYTVIGDDSSGYSAISCNAYPVEGNSTWHYLSTSSIGASKYELNFGQHTWYTAAAGTRGNDVTWTQRLHIDSNGHVTPGGDDTQDLGSSSKRWRNIYTGDLQLSNEGSSNDVDGTWGKYTIQEGEEELFIINRRTGKKFKFVLEEVN